MRVCYRGNEVVDAFHEDLRGKVLVDRFVENAIEIDVDALCDGEETYVAAVMQHVEEAGVHSGDSACVLPAPSLTGDDGARGRGGRAPARARARDGRPDQRPARGRRRRRSTCSRRTRAPRGRCRSPRRRPGSTSSRPRAGSPRARSSRDLGLPAERPPEQVSVKAAVLPFSRFPGADPVLGPEMRSTGEVMASASDLPTAFAKAERAAGRPLPTSGTAFLSVRDADKRCARAGRRSARRARLPAVATAGTARALREAGLEVEQVAKVAEGAEATVVDLIRRGRCDLVVNTPVGGSLQRTRRLPDPRGRARRPRAVHHDDLRAPRRPCTRSRTRAPSSRCRLQERIDAETTAANGH